LNFTFFLINTQPIGNIHVNLTRVLIEILLVLRIVDRIAVAIGGRQLRFCHLGPRVYLFVLVSSWCLHLVHINNYNREGTRTSTSSFVFVLLVWRCRFFVSLLHDDFPIRLFPTRKPHGPVRFKPLPTTDKGRSRDKNEHEWDVWIRMVQNYKIPTQYILNPVDMILTGQDGWVKTGGSRGCARVFLFTILQKN
jgi:hypothetical protein